MRGASPSLLSGVRALVRGSVKGGVARFSLSASPPRMALLGHEVEQGRCRLCSPVSSLSRSPSVRPAVDAATLMDSFQRKPVDKMDTNSSTRGVGLFDLHL